VISEFRVRAARPTDAATIDRLLGDFQAEDGWPRRGVHAAVRGALKRRGAHGLRVFLAEDARGVVVGFASAWMTVDLGDGPGIWLSDLYVAPAGRRRGVGRALAAAVARAGRDAGAVWMVWHVGRRNRAARRFYASIGAQEKTEHVVSTVEGRALARLAASARGSRNAR
jgi:GNAT superfamily N-acetyltransferase